MNIDRLLKLEEYTILNSILCIINVIEIIIIYQTNPELFIMCCRTNSFYCTHDMRKGIIFAGVIDVILLITLVVLNIILLTNYLSLLFLIIIVADILLIIGAIADIAGLLLVWMVFGMINIVILFIGWIALPIWGFLIASFVTAVCTEENVTFENDIDCPIMFVADHYLIGTFVLNAILIYGLPIYYIYLWVAVKSHRENLITKEITDLPIPVQEGIFFYDYLNM